VNTFSSAMGNNQNTIMDLLFSFAISFHFPADVTNQVNIAHPTAKDLENVIICAAPAEKFAR
jgi:hypothetical protein